jgi:hypothetical protein
MGYARHDEGIHRVFVNPSSIGDNVVLAAQGFGALGTGLKIRVLYIVAVAAAANVITLKSGSTAISAAKSLGINGGFILPRDANGWYETGPNQALNIALTAATAVGVDIGYVVVT